jgi:hypothetical protein
VSPYRFLPISFSAVRAEDNTFFLPITASLTVGVLWRRSTAPASSGAFAAYKGRTPCVIVTIFSFTNRIVTGAESFAATKPVPGKSRAVFYAESAGNTLLIAL